jgi:hypothetical protein
LSVTAIGPRFTRWQDKGNIKVKTRHSVMQIVAGALLAAGVLAAGLGAGTGQTSTVYGPGSCPVGHYCGLLGR